MDDYRFTTHICRNEQELEATRDDCKVILDGLGSNAQKKLGNIAREIPVRIFIRNKENLVVGGIVAVVYGNWVFIDLLWVDESLRGKDYGTQLMNKVEKEALQLGCKYAYLDTFGYEAKPFYEKLGYEVFGTLENYIGEHSKYFLKKTLIK